MRLNLYWRGRDVLDIEAHLWRKRPDDDEPEQPKLQAAANLADSSRAEPMDAPDTYVAFGFGKP